MIITMRTLYLEVTVLSYLKCSNRKIYMILSEFPGCVADLVLVILPLRPL